VQTLTASRIASLVLAGISLPSCTSRPPAASPTARVETGIAATPLASAPDRFLVDGDVRLRYRETGRSQPVLLLHGLTRRPDGSPRGGPVRGSSKSPADHGVIAGDPAALGAIRAIIGTRTASGARTAPSAGR
jgi:hypothetical protein